MYEIFADLLKQHGITAYRVAKETGITTATLTDWKKGRSTPKADKLQIIAAYFGVSVDYLLGNEKEPATNSDGFTVTDRPEDEFVGFYGEVKDDLTQDDLDDIKKLMAIRAELNRNKGK